ncbi:MAG: signal peptidase II [Candidatus Gracilibacteria bacterium]|nr:signal peptidase II [Candidatus Gracilibacteria bacterium]
MRIFVATIILSVFVDLYSKFLASDYLINETNLIGDFVFLKLIENPGIAFSILMPPIIIKILTIILIIGIFYYYYTDIRKLNLPLLDVAFGLIIGGAMANGYERIINEKVIDFIGVKGFSIFNLADSFITIGAIIFVLFSLSHILKKNG